MSSQKNSSEGTKVIQRTGVLLRTLAAHNRTGLRLVDVMRLTGLERSTAHRLLQGLSAENMVAQDPSSKRYFIGMGMYEIGISVPAARLRDFCHEHLQAIADRCGDTVMLTVRSGFDGVCVDRREGRFPVANVLEVGRRRPLIIGASNTAMLSRLSDDEIARIRFENLERAMRLYPRLAVVDLDRRITDARLRGYVLTDVIERVGMRAMAICLADGDGRPLGAISVSAPSERLQGEHADLLLHELRQAASFIQGFIQTSGISIRNFEH